jgi:AraC-like DNA-binding protein
MIRHDGDQVGIALELNPLGARALFGLPASALSSTLVEPHEVLGPGTASLQERLSLALSWPQRFGLLDEVLMSCMKESYDEPIELARAWQLLVHRSGAIAIQKLADEVGWSRRHLTERFRAEFGVAPKTAARMLRFDRARRSLTAKSLSSVADAAVAAGYFDQAHLTRDFQEFAGCSPGRWLAEEFPFVQDGLTDEGPE